MWNPNIFFGILERLDGVNGEILNESKRSMQVKAQLDKTAYRSRHGTNNQSALVTANPAVRVENQAAILT